MEGAARENDLATANTKAASMDESTENLSGPIPNSLLFFEFPVEIENEAHQRRVDD